MSSRSCSSRRALAALAVAALAACRHAPPPAPAWAEAIGARPLVAVFPVDNLTGGRAPVKAITAELRRALEAAGFRLAPADAVDAVLAQRRIRYTAGVDREAAAALHGELGVDAVLLSALDAWAPRAPPVFALSARLVLARDPPRIAWADRVAMTGKDDPGLFGMGLVGSIDVLQQRALARLMASLARGEDASPDRAARFAPGHRYRSPVLDAPDRRTIAVLPFVNDSGRRDAGQAVALDFTEQLVRTGAFDVVEPGQSRREMLAYRVILDGGVSLDNAMVVLEQIGADLVLSGSVLTYADSASREGAPEVQITAYVLDGRTKRVVWSSTSHAQGDDGVFFFGIGRVNAVAALASRMAREVAERIAGERPRPKNTMAGARVAPSRRADWRPIRETSDETP